MTRARDGALAFAAVLAGWQVLVWLTAVPPFILPGPLRVAEALVLQHQLILQHATVTVVEILLGIALGTLLGAVTALQLMMSRRALGFVLPVLVFSQAVPVFALAPLLTLWLGYGLGAKVAMAVLIIYFPVVSSFLDGLRHTEPVLVEMARCFGATKGQILRHIRLPAALPSFGSGLRLAAVYAPIGAVIGEWVGASQGLGYLMLLANGRAKTDLMFAALFVLALFTVVLHRSVGLLADHLARRAKGMA
ncbi:MAG: ABC transporter permease subunit [Kiloniellaceae bacterium]|nr:ABC transporter permease subunit [Kiloniellaceae bacterium]